VSDLAEAIPRVPHEFYRLSNGLEVILVEDHRLPLVGVNVNYKVGSKNERPGRTGFAHLFEHMMFQGSQHFNDDYFKALQDIGGAVNGATNPDRTRYWELLPAAHLERALWLEADRMGFLLEALTQERLDNQRSVVQNERRQHYENRPYGLVWERLLALLYPPDHPYHWPTIGFMADLAAATLDDVRDFFTSYYGPSNASLCIAGDFSSAVARELVEKYFGALSPGPPVATLARRVPTPHGGEVSLAMEDRVQLPRAYLAWHTVPLYDQDDAALDAFARILGQGRTSRLYRRLVYELGIAQEAVAVHSGQQLAGTFTVVLTPRPGHSLREVERSASAVLQRLLEDGPTADELQRVAALTAARVIGSMQSVGGFAGLSDAITQYVHYLGEPDRFRWDVERTLQLTPEQVRDAACRYLGPHRAAVRVAPRLPLAGSNSPVALTVNRSVMPGPGRARPLALPPRRRITLDNGLEVVHVEQRHVPAFAAVLVARAGAAADPPSRPGLAALTAAVLPEGAGNRNASQLAEELEHLGAQLEARVSADGFFVAASGISVFARETLQLLADVAVRPTLADEEVERQRTRRLVHLRQLLDSPEYLAHRAARRGLFGDHPYGRPTLGTPAGVAGSTPAEVRAAWAAALVPGNATLVIVGDVGAEELERVLANTFTRWQKPSVPLPALPTPPAPPPRAVHLIDRPGAAQSVIAISLPGPPRLTPYYPALEVLNTAFGGQFVSRLNLNLREDKGYTYGARSRFQYWRHAGQLMVTAPVATAVTAAAVREMVAELDAVAGLRPLTAEEVAYAAHSLANGYLRTFETPAQLARVLAEAALYELPDDALERFPQEVAAVTAEPLATLAAAVIRPAAAIIAIAGDRAATEADLAALDLGPLVPMDPEALTS